MYLVQLLSQEGVFCGELQVITPEYMLWSMPSLVIGIGAAKNVRSLNEEGAQTAVPGLQAMDSDCTCFVVDGVNQVMVALQQ